MKNILLLLLILMTSFGFAQDRPTQIKLDSLETKLSTVKNDSVKLSILVGLGRDYALHSNKRNFEFNQKAIELAKKLNKPMAIAEAYGNYGYYYGSVNDTLKQTEYLDKILALGKEKKDNSILGRGHFDKAMFFWGRNNLIQAKYHFEQSEEFTKKTGNKNTLGNVYLQLGYLYQNHFYDYNKALSHYRKYTDLFDKDDIQLVNTYIRIGTIYRIQGNYEKELEYYMLSDDLFKKHNQINDSFYANLLGRIAGAYVNLKDYDTSVEYFDLSLEYFLNIKDYRSSVIIYTEKAKMYLLKNNTKKALETIYLAEKQVDKAEKCFDKELSYKSIGYFYYEMKNYSKALEFHLKTYNECPKDYPYKDFEEQEYNIGATYLMLAKNIEQIKIPTTEIPKDQNKLLQLSEEYLQKAKKSSHSKNLFYYAGSVNLLHEVYDLRGNKAKALEYYKEYIVFKDSLKSIENRELLIQNQMQFEFDQQEKIRLAEQETKDALTREEIAKEKSRRNMALAGVGIFVLLAGFAGYAFVQKRKDNKIIATEKQKSDDLLLNILPEEVANELKEKGTSDAKHFESVSIMFTDFKDFTKLSEKIPSKELIEELNYCFKAFDEIVAKHGVEKIKTIGDSYMAVCGLPAQDGNHAQKMVQTALEIRDFIEDYKKKRQKEGKSFFEMRIGINSGEVVAGIVGIKKFAYDIWGDAVNTASRMESNGVIGKVNISESTYNLIKDDFDFEYRGEIETKGKGEIKMYFVEHKS